MNLEELSAVVVDSAYHLHVDLGPGLLETVYETVLARILSDRGLKVERQKAVVFEYQGIRFEDGLRVDLLINDRLVVELKSVETLAPVHAKQLLTYLRLLNQPLGLLINFGAATFKEGIKRVVNQHRDFASSRESGDSESGAVRWHARPRRSRRGRPDVTPLSSRVRIQGCGADVTKAACGAMRAYSQFVENDSCRRFVGDRVYAITNP